ncbi:hypothetical protein BJ165DRAFT_1467282 [Panaeolus papilionaceus]|nr:hypothetical protein BJ165DRAFT_1467282 [Panaeolus papilionaceus]
MPAAHCGGSNDDHIVSGNHNPNLPHNRPPSTDPNRHHGSHDPNSSQSSTSPPVVPAKVLTKARPGEQSGGGSSSSRSSAAGSTPRSDPESPKSLQEHVLGHKAYPVEAPPPFAWSPRLAVPIQKEVLPPRTLQIIRCRPIVMRQEGLGNRRRQRVRGSTLSRA